MNNSALRRRPGSDSRSASAATPPDAVLLVAWRDDLGLLAADHPAGADLGIQMHVHLVLEHHGFVVRQTSNEPLDLPQLRPVLWIARADDRAWSTPNEGHPVQTSPHGLRTQADVLSFPQQQRQQLERLATAEEAEVLGREAQQPSRHDDQPRRDRHFGAPLFEHTSQASGMEVTFHGGNQRGTGKGRPADLSVRVLISQQQQDQRATSRSRQSVHLQTDVAFLRRKSNTAVHGLPSGGGGPKHPQP